ncbi:unnamed protein product [Echinostoma caproni]|uniref:Transposase n=1 Tax=Echinostoma caproni TaxID=27848 RepID=A0A183ANU1_9TREM|nr:unnamed protein product [Echinostoma caproni]
MDLLKKLRDAQRTICALHVGRVGLMPYKNVVRTANRGSLKHAQRSGTPEIGQHPSAPEHARLQGDGRMPKQLLLQPRK